MRLGRFVWVTVVGALLALPLAAHAQEATLNGSVRDNTGAVLPGVTVTATHEAAGTTFVGVTDERGLYRMPVRAGVYRITAELPGSPRSLRPGVELLLGRQVTLNLELAVSGVQETVTVTGEAPLIDTTSSNIAQQHRPAADAGPAAQRPQLDGPDAAGARQPDELGDRDPAGPAGLLPGQRRRPAGDVHAVLPAEPAALQPRLDRGVRADDEPVRRDARAARRA